MNDEIKIVGYKKISGDLLEYRFSDDSVLLMAPIKNFAYYVERLDAAMLYQRNESGVLEQRASFSVSPRGKYKGYFWQNENFTQEALAEYWNKAIVLGKQLLKDRKTGKMSSDEWEQTGIDFWLIPSCNHETREYLERGCLLTRKHRYYAGHRFPDSLK